MKIRIKTWDKFEMKHNIAKDQTVQGALSLHYIIKTSMFVN